MEKKTFHGRRLFLAQLCPIHTIRLNSVAHALWEAKKGSVVFWLAATLLGLVGGCRPKQPALRICYVRLSALLPYSLPLYPSHVNPPALPSLQQTAFGAFPQTFASPPAIGAMLAEERRQQLTADAARYIARYKEALEDAATLDMARYKKEQEIAAQEQLLKASSSIRTDIAAKLRQQLSDLQHQQMVLQFRQAAVQTQVRASSAPLANSQTRQDALLQQQLIAQQLAQVENKRRLLLAQADKSIEGAIAQTQQQIEGELQKRLANYKNQQEEEIARKAMEAAAAQATLQQEVNLPLAPLPKPPTKNRVPLPLPPISVDASALKRAQQQVQQSEIKEGPQTDKMIKEFFQLRMKVLQQEVNSIVQQQGWRLVPPNTPGAFDATTFVQTQLLKEREPASR